MSKPITFNVVRRIQTLEAELSKLRKVYGISKPGEQIWTHCTNGDDRYLVVTADGVGGASLRYIHKLGETDELEFDTRDFQSEDKACALASRWTNFDPENGDIDERDDLFNATKYPESEIEA